MTSRLFFSLRPAASPAYHASPPAVVPHYHDRGGVNMTDYLVL